MVTEKSKFVNQVSYSRSVQRADLALTSGERIRKRKFAPPAPPPPILTIGRNISLELTLQSYEITPNATTVAKIGGER